MATLLKEWMDHKSISPTEFARRIGKSVAFVSEYMKIRKNYRVGTIGMFAAALGITSDEFMAGPPKGSAELAKAFALVPHYDIQASAGLGRLVELEREDMRLAFRRDYIAAILKTATDDLFLLDVNGVSMEPTLRAGDTILVDRGRKRGDGEIFLLRRDGELFVKRVTRNLDGTLRISSDNQQPEYKPVDIAPDDVEIIGKVVWFARTIG